MKTKKLKAYMLCFLSIFLACTLHAEDTNVIVNGKARFTVLTPTLIRTEYSGDGIFENRNSFNTVKNNLPVPAYTTTVDNDWLEIQTEKLTLRYKQESGIFDSTNLIVSLNNNNQPTIAKPWSETAKFSGYSKEAESTRLLGGARVATDHLDYSGTGFVAGLKTVGSGMEWALKNRLPAGQYVLSLKYSNGMTSDNTISLYIDGEKTQITLKKTANWEEWKIFQKTVSLDMGQHTFKILCDEGDTYNVNIDWISIAPVLNINQLYEAETAALTGGAITSADHTGFSGTSFVAGLKNALPRITWHINNNMGDDSYVVMFKYANGIPADNKHITRTLSLYVDGNKEQISFEPTADWKTWGIFEKTVALNEGTHTIELSCDAGDTYHVNIDWLAVIPEGGDTPDENANSIEKTNLGAWSRGLDEKRGSIPLWDGILSRDGWYLLDDSETAVYNDEGWVVDRDTHPGGYLDGYFFGYGSDYQTALKDFYKITDNPVLLPKWAFGVWYSINSETYTNAAYYKNELLPAFRSKKVPLDVLVVDTDWKSPERWNGWNWNSTNFPDPQGFMDWTKEEGLIIPLNVHPTIQNNDSRFSQANTTAGGLIKNGNRYHFDFTNKQHAQAYFDLHEPFNTQGARFWWFDQAETPNSEIAGVPADTWINGLYTKYANDQGLRGFAFSRIGSGHAGYSDAREPGIAWSEHRYTLHFTGDTYATWDMLAFQSTFTIKEANIGIPYVSHDLGSYHGDQLSDDMYMRWVQFGTFQPIFRLHSKRGKRLPWQYPNVEEQAKSFILLRHALVPYTYTLAHESSTGGMPVVRGMYFYYPDAAEAYSFDKQYFYGEKMLVSPIVSSGENASTSVWFPEGKWTNFFTNQVVDGPATQNISAGYNSMPVFVKAGGIIPLAPYSDYVGQNVEDSLTVRVYTGADGEFTLYEDEGENLNYQAGGYALTQFIYTAQEQKFSIKAQKGNYTGAPEKRAYDIEFYNASIPEKIIVNGVELNAVAKNSAEGWWVDKDVIYLKLNKRPVTTDINIVFDGTSSNPLVLNPHYKLYPNPATDSFTIELDTEEASSVRIYNVKGEKVFDEIINDKKTAINTQAFAKGFYIIEIDNEDNRVSEKLIIK